MKPFTNMQTILPAHIQMYMRQLAIVHYGSLQATYEDMVAKFIMVRPWEASPALEWREAPVRTDAGCSIANISLSYGLAEKVNKTLEEINDKQYVGFEKYGITIKAFLYTAIYWWVTYIYPQRKA